MNNQPQLGYGKFQEESGDQFQIVQGQPCVNQQIPQVYNDQQQAQNFQAFQYPQQQIIQAQPQNLMPQFAQVQIPQMQSQQQVPQQQYILQGVNPIAPYNIEQLTLPKYPTSRYSQTLYCDNCNRPIETRVVYEPGTGAYLAGGLIALCGLWMGCCLAPCMIEDCKDAVHMCNQCGQIKGKKKFLFD